MNTRTAEQPNASSSHLGVLRVLAVEFFGSGLTVRESRRRPAKSGAEAFFLPVRVRGRLFRRLSLHDRQGAFDRRQLRWHSSLEPGAAPPAFRRLLDTARTTDWVVYATPPCGGPAQVLDYLGRDPHRVAITNHRLLALADDTVTFRLKDYRQENRLTSLTLEAGEFIRRFLLHVLPDGFMRIRQYGFLSNRHRAPKLARCRALLGVPEAPDSAPPPPQDWTTRYEALTGEPVDGCPACHQGRLLRVDTLSPLGFPLRPLPPGIDSS